MAPPFPAIASWTFFFLMTIINTKKVFMKWNWQKGQREVLCQPVLTCHSLCVNTYLPP